jgi:hypothetical protein
MSAPGSVAGGADSSACCSWTLENPSSAGDPVSLLCVEPNIELKGMATAGAGPVGLVAAAT